jgi:hypothetical protein
MNTARMLAWLVLPLVALVAVGALAIWLFKALLGVLFYLVVGAVVAGGAVYLYNRAKRAVGPGTRTRRRIDAAAETYRMRNR